MKPEPEHIERVVVRREDDGMLLKLIALSFACGVIVGIGGGLLAALFITGGR